jgi:Leucine-rich repeat (LRR) protein
MLTLAELWLNNNQIGDVQEIEVVSHLRSLKTLYVEFNPLCEDTQHRKKIATFQPNLEQVYLINLFLFPSQFPQIDASLVIKDAQRKAFMETPSQFVR